MKKTLKQTWILGVLALLIPTLALAWWNNDWGSRKTLTLDAGATGADIQATLSDVPVLVRLHTGNFGYFTELAENGKDLRFALDDKTPLKHAIEKVDALSEIGLVWIKVPTVRGAVSTDAISMYYGNQNAVEASDAKGIYDVNQSLVFHFNEGETLPQDATAYGNHASTSKAVIQPAGWIGAAADFQNGGISINANPSLAITTDEGLTFSTWAKIPQAQNATLFQSKDSALNVELQIVGGALVGRYQNISTPAVNFTPNQWQHIALVVRQNALELYVDGQKMANAPITLSAFTPSLFIGGSENGQAFTGSLDEVQFAKQARSADWIKFASRSQSPDFTVLNFGADESNSSASGPNYFVIILQSLTVDGWVVIALCGVMMVISSIVIIGKSIAINRARKDNTDFLAQYRNIDSSDLGALDREESEEEHELADSDFLTAVVGKHDHFQSSPIYHVYHAGVHELKKTFGGISDNAILTPEALNLVRTRLDAAVVREGQKLNKNMVLLTIAISGGPFLGLLGTVMGVMITFAVIAASGDVNINSIAPGISGALAATVAGLIVAIPALFAYNYLLTQIKEITADMHVFTDEFLAIISKRIADRQRSYDDVQYVVLTDEFIAKISERVIAKQRENAL
jgi:biopolymer transport protein ExbB